MRVGREVLLIGGEALAVGRHLLLRGVDLGGRGVKLGLSLGELPLAGGDGRRAGLLDGRGLGVELGLRGTCLGSAVVDGLLPGIDLGLRGVYLCLGLVIGGDLLASGLDVVALGLGLEVGPGGLKLRECGLGGGQRLGELGGRRLVDGGVGELGLDLGDLGLGRANLALNLLKAVVELLELGTSGLDGLGVLLEGGAPLLKLLLGGVDLDLAGVELDGLLGKLGHGVVVCLDLSLGVGDAGLRRIVLLLLGGELLLGDRDLGLGLLHLRRRSVERRLSCVELRLGGSELGLGRSQVLGLGGKLRLALGDGRGRRVERGLVLVDLGLGVVYLRLPIDDLRLGVVDLVLAVRELGRGVGKRLRGVVKGLFGVGQLLLGVVHLGLAVVDSLLRVSHDRGEARGRPVGDKPLHLGFVGLHEVSVLVGVRVDALGVLEGHASRHVDVGVELLAHDHGVALEAARAGRRLAHVHDGDDLGRVDMANHGVLGVVQAGLVAQGVGLLAHGDGGADGVLLADVRVDGNLALALGHAAVDELELGDLVGHAHHAHGVRRALDRHVLEVAVLDGRRAARLVDGGDVIVVQAVVAQNGEVGQRILAEVGLARGAHVRAGDEKADERERPERHEQHNRYEASL